MGCFDELNKVSSMKQTWRKIPYLGKENLFEGGGFF